MRTNTLSSIVVSMERVSAILEMTPEQFALILNGKTNLAGQSYQMITTYSNGQERIKVASLGELHPGQEYELVIKLVEKSSGGKERG